MNVKNSLFSLAACLSIVGCESLSSATNPSSEIAKTQPALDIVADEVWFWALKKDHSLPIRMGLPIVEINDITPEQRSKDAREAEGFILRLNQISDADLSLEEQVTKRFLIWYLEDYVGKPQADEYVFAMTPYLGGFPISFFYSYAPVANLEGQSHRDDYLSFLEEFADLIDQSADKTIRQSEKGIYLPKPALPGARNMVGSLQAAIVILVPGGDRLDHLNQVERDAFLSQIDKVIQQEILPAFERFQSVIGEEYEQRAPAALGFSQYVGGSEAYQNVIRQYTSSTLSPEQIHQIGLSYMEEIAIELQQVRDEIGFEGTQSEFHDLLKRDPRFIARSPEDVESRYLYHLSRIEPLMSDYFSLQPDAPYGVKRSDPANETGQTFGMYQGPTLNEPRGLYRYNGSNLEDRSMISAAHLIFHELIPGHHLHMALQAEQERLPKLQRNLVAVSLSSFNEGWAEYAAHLGVEMGLFEDPYDRYGQLIFESFFTARLVVDTGLNALGWTQEQAEAYLLENTMLSEREVASEILRYSTDMPGQALAYRLGRDHFENLRRRIETELGESFDIKDFHAASVSQGALPLDVLSFYVKNKLIGSASVSD